MLLTAAVENQHRHAGLLIGLGMAQLVAWGTLYYAIAVLGQPMRRELGLTAPELFGVFTGSLTLSGLLAPWAGALVDRWGGRLTLAASSCIAAAGFVLLAVSHTFLTFSVAWTLHGLAMALGLYDTCFAALAQVVPASYRRSVTAVTLIAGFASSVAWPTTHYLLLQISWRGTCFIYAASLAVCAVLYLAVLPSRVEGRAVAKPSLSADARLTSRVRTAGRMLALAFAGAAFIAGALSAHLIDTLTARDISREHAVWLASSVGALQVVGRLVEGVFAQRNTALQVGFVTFGLLAASTVVLLASGSAAWLVVPFVVMYGVSNGLLTITKATIPVELLGFENVGAMLGTFSAPSLLTRAAAPFGFAFLTSSFGVTGTLAVLVLVGGAALGAYIFATRVVSRARELRTDT